MKLLIPPPLVALAGALIMWVIATQLAAWQVIFPLQNVLGYALIALGLAMDIVALLAFSKAKTSVTPLAPEKASQLVTSGLYRITRNPMYLGLLLILTGIAVLLGSPVNILVLVGFVAYITQFQIKPEEERLEQMFGEDFRTFKQRVRRWL